MSDIVIPSTIAKSLAHVLFRRVADEAGTAILDSTVPIYCVSNGCVHFNRTGLLFRIGSEHFVITAAHSLKQYLEEEVPLCVDLSRETELPIPLLSSKFYYTEAENQAGGRDIAAIHLDSESVGQFYPQRRFLTIAQCDLDLEAKAGLYMAAGYPDALYEMTPLVRGAAMFFIGTSEPTPQSSVFDPRVHLALSLDGAGLRATDSGIIDDAVPRFPGMSGCGIWRVAPAGLGDPAVWNPSMVRLAAIQNRTKHGGHTIGTWIKHVVDRIVADCPHLAPAVSIAYPPGY
jgi:hypothetical protein